MKIKLIDVGRSKVNKTAVIDTSKGLVNDSLEDTLAGVASHYLMSSDVQVEKSPEKNLYTVFAGFHAVGKIEVVEV